MRKSENDYLREISNFTESLLIFYHIILLLELGIDKGKIRQWIASGFQALQTEFFFKNSGLLGQDQSIRVRN